MSDHSYVARFGWMPRDLILLPVCVVFIVVGVLVVRDSPLLGVGGCLLGGGYVVLSVAAWVSRRVAFAVTAEGITLGLMWPWPANRSAFVPWSDIQAVVLWRQDLYRSATMRYVGVVRRAGAPPLPGSARSATLRSLNMAYVPEQLPEDLVADSRPVSFWRLDKRRLTAAVEHFGRGVPLVDNT